jgi:uncharacterized phage-like protein YoqJ
MRARQTSCCFSGHRPEKLPWGSNENDERCVALKRRLWDAVETAYEEGYRHFICGMARGCDFYFAEAVLALKGEGLPVRLEAWLPCPEQSNHWPEEDRERYERILLDCDGVYILEPQYSEGCMLRRNRAMIDRCDWLISVWDGSRGGTASAVRYARLKAVPIEALWL